MNIYEKIKIRISQENIDTTPCKHNHVIFPDDKYLWLSEIIIC